ncbi:uncharacterized protein LOC121377941 [Gigantopelta aegis]|uniref:uncharacterized protein LOC121377941 n=1 Tax=Gigantopelta aegis TaxID=1735272 RepID=UPI001B88AC18|nr:uncharacterized protein LOC121377941 [Gigantopelta aegis]
MEKYISFSVGSLRFIDSLQFLNASLETLVTNLKADGSDKFTQLTKEFSDEQKISLLLRKGVYPYDFMDDESKFNMSQLPAQAEFYNSLTDSDISDEDYEHAHQVWTTFDLKTMGEYHDLYMKTDVLLLADVFENFRNMCLDYYDLDSAHYFTLPGVGWDAMLKMGGVELELLTDLDMHLMIEHGLRGGISMISKKFSKANNPYLETFNENEPSTYLMYLDANNLYGHSMSQYLPERDFEWVKDLDSLDIMTVTENSNTGYILEVDLEYPTELHDCHRYYPLAPESMLVTDAMLSPHSQQLRDKLCLTGRPVRKLVPNLNDKEKYVLHYRNLQFYLRQGIKLTKIHRAIQFRQSPWLKTYIDFNTEKRKQSKNETEKAFFKLMNNSCFGRSMMNVRKHVNVELVNSKKRLTKLCAKPAFEGFKIFNPDLAAVHLKKATIFLNQPIYAGFSILDMSKIVMYEFHYDFMRAKYGNKVQLLFTDTDSLCYEIETEDIYSDFQKHANLFDTSNYNLSHPLFSIVNAKVLGKMKDELGGSVMEEFVGLRPKMYSVLYEGKEKKIAKGVSKTVIKKVLKHTMYKKCLFEHSQLRHSMTNIQSVNHQLYSVATNMISLSPYDDKRYVLEDGIHTLAHGHYRTPTGIID